MKLLLSLLLMLAIVPIVMTSTASAQVDISSDICETNNAGNGQVPAICADIDSGESTNVIYGKDGVLTRAVFALSILVGIASVVVIIIAGIRLMLSQGDPAKIAKSRTQIIYALVGVVVVVASQLLVQLVLNRIGA